MKTGRRGFFRRVATAAVAAPVIAKVIEETAKAEPKGEVVRQIRMHLEPSASNGSMTFNHADGTMSWSLVHDGESIVIRRANDDEVRIDGADGTITFKGNLDA